ncbi:DNA internalization-related competence protein ComEC/Rec2 [Georgfuchsia toluolica]|uniref:DNA internalization-related competence protein ComEC/Rec2 n=1 Tax=Georgfuchsia toluolica TaxID=424218 RepID=A0A916J686_9PROT|nr:DNA internalization-related competence protein ComEC/Rec2 [Georgfuchsia toluolica]CAG4883176.1 DNA internalization-related competence protein ComEC/Rec2 [Georgfuchsia toluolica]
MTIVILAFAAGVLWLQTQAALPDGTMLLGMSAIGALCCGASAAKVRLRWVLPVGTFLFGIVWAGWFAGYRMADQLPLSSEGRDIDVVGVVAEMPQITDRGTRFRFAVESSTLPVPRQISLTWYAHRMADDDVPEVVPVVVHAGERWRFQVRLKRPHGSLNPESFDYEAWLFERGIRATGYIRDAPDSGAIKAHVPGFGIGVERLRERLRDRYQSVLGDRPYAGILIALSVGDQQAISPGLWQIFSRTGLTHLMSISGLHITMVAGLFYMLAGWLWRRSSRLPLYLPAQHAAALGGVAAAFAYCLLAGFAVPAQRTLYMLTTVAAASLLRRRPATRQMLAIALLVVLLLDPWAVFSAGFWLSFGAVALLFYTGSGRLAAGHWLSQWGRAQWAMLAGMLPLLLALFQQFSLVSPLANALAIPIISFIVTPLTLLAALPGLQFLLWPAYWVTQLLMLFVAFLADLPGAIWQQHAPPLWATLLALIGTAWLMLPRAVPARWVGVLLYLPLLFVPPERPLEGDMKMAVLDVGQGLAVHVQTHGHDLIFDTGPSFAPDADSGTRVLVPYLRAAGVQKLDGLVVSHEDNDHEGGADSLLQAIPTGWLLSSLPFEHPLSAAPVRHVACSDGQRWQWDGVSFEVLHPAAAQYLHPPPKTNNMSCVLRVVSRQGSVLLTGDIETVDEMRLLQRHATELRSDVLLVPHHGSNTSSSPEFIAAVAASRGVFTVGYRNRFAHPRPNIVARYRERNVQMFRSDEDGAVSFDFRAGGIQVSREREQRKRYWHGA